MSNAINAMFNVLIGKFFVKIGKNAGYLFSNGKGAVHRPLRCLKKSLTADKPHCFHFKVVQLLPSIIQKFQVSSLFLLTVEASLCQTWSEI